VSLIEQAIRGGTVPPRHESPACIACRKQRPEAPKFHVRRQAILDTL
jgi:hypothetical protein